jgi:hypothetical protein
MSNDAEWIADIARDEAEKVLADHTIPAAPVYFAPRADALVTYDWFVYERNATNRRIDDLTQRILKLERPWWRRWLNR